MRWQFWASEDPKRLRDDNKTAQPLENALPVSPSVLEKPDISGFTLTQTATFSIITTVAVLGLLRTYKLYLRRIPTSAHLKPNTFRKRSLYGYVTSVGDGDNFRLFHTPGGKLAGWGWLRTRYLAGDRKWLQDKTIHVRIAGVDAPEGAHFGRPAQPFSQGALEWLRGEVLHKYVRVKPFRRDQYERVVCGVAGWRWFGMLGKKDVGLEMLKIGYGTVYEAKFGSEFAGMEDEYRAAEQRAKQKKVGMWHEPGLVGKLLLGKKSAGEFESPREYKNRMAKEDLAK